MAIPIDRNRHEREMPDDRGVKRSREALPVAPPVAQKSGKVHAVPRNRRKRGTSGCPSATFARGCVSHPRVERERERGGRKRALPRFLIPVYRSTAKPVLHRTGVPGAKRAISGNLSPGRARTRDDFEITALSRVREYDLPSYAVRE